MFRKLVVALAIPALASAQNQMQTPMRQGSDTIPRLRPNPDTTFRPISLADALRLARENNVSNITAANSVRSSNLQVRSARAELFPSLSASAGQGISAGDRVGQSGTLVPYTAAWTYNTGLSLNQTLFDAGKSFADVRAAKAGVAAQEANQVAQQFNVSLNVKQQYNSVLAAREAEAAADAQLALAQQQLQVSIARVNAGAANVSDSLNNVVAVGNAQLNILNAQQNARAASAALTRLVGTPYLVTAVASDTIELSHTPVDSATLMAWALDGPTIRQAQAQVTSAQAQYRSARTGYFPTISARANYSGSGTGKYGFGSDPFPYSRGLNLSLNFPIFQGYQRENNIASAQIAQDNAQAQIKDQRLLAQQTIITQIGLLRNDEEKMRVQQINVRASEEALRVNQQRYALGAGTLLDVLTSQSNLILARQQLIQTRLDYRNARAQIEATIGRDLP
jgi:outer membrane protein